MPTNALFVKGKVDECLYKTMQNMSGNHFFPTNRTKQTKIMEL